MVQVSKYVYAVSFWHMLQCHVQNELSGRRRWISRFTMEDVMITSSYWDKEHRTQGYQQQSVQVEQQTKELIQQSSIKKTPWSESTSELYRPNDRRLLAKLVSTFADRGCHVVSVIDPYGRNIGFLDRNRYFFFEVALHLYSRGWVNSVPDPLVLRKSGSAGNRTRTSGSVARNSDHQTTEAVNNPPCQLKYRDHWNWRISDPQLPLLFRSNLTAYSHCSHLSSTYIGPFLP
jgi:hypothetical protein